MQINHVGIEVEDIYEMELFYKRVFDFKLVYRNLGKTNHDLITVLLQRGPIRLKLIKNLKKDKIKSNFHISFHVSNVFSEYKRLKLLRIKGIIEPEQTDEGFIEFCFNDPEGNIIEISRKIAKVENSTIKAVIFDLDGTLIDSEGNYFEADQILFSQYNVDFTLAMKEKFVGFSTKKMIIELKEKFHLDESEEYLTDMHNKLYMEIAKLKTKVFPEMIKFLEMLKKDNYKVAVATGSSKMILDTIFSVTNLKDYFEIVVSSEEVPSGKPAPDIFIETAKRLGVAPENCLVVEDSQYGVEAAKRAYMSCIAVPFIVDKISESFLMADLLYKNGMNEFNAKKAYKWLNSQNN